MSATAEAPATERTEHRFAADVNQVLDIVVHSLYSHREIFLRELISNASDALDKLRLRALTEEGLLGGDADLEVRLRADAEAKTLTIRDNGVGMSRDELIENLGTIAHSGSKKFVEQLKAKGAASGAELIGQFGVGFYSAFLVADKVEVTSRAAGATEAWRWASEAHGTFSIGEADPGFERGTEVKLHLKDEHKGYCDGWRIRDLVERYSDYVSHPIKLWVEPESGDDEAEADEGAEAKAKAKPEPRWEKVNRGTALWKRPKSEVTEDQYTEFFKHLTHDWEAPLGYTHFTIEGTQLFTGLLGIPARPPFDLFDRNKRRGVRLYVRRVFIMDDCEELLPEWLRFVRGVIDSDDLPLNVSRELLQQEDIVRTIKKQVVKKSLDLLEDLAANKPDTYEKVWKAYGQVVKEGLHFDWENRERLAKLVRFASSKSPLTSLADYVSRMPEGQKAIYYLIGESRGAVAGSPHAEALVKRGYEVLYLTDPVDDWAVEGLREFEGKRLCSAMKTDLDLDESEDEKKAHEAQKGELEGLLARMQTVLAGEVKEVRLSKRLTDSPCCLVIPEGGLHAHMERLLRAHDRDVPAQRRVLELNGGHPVIRRLAELHAKDGESAAVAEWARFLHDHALITEGSPLKDPQAFARRMTALMAEGIERGFAPIAPAAKAPEAEPAAPAEAPTPAEGAAG